jgi:hypothetical protein
MVVARPPKAIGRSLPGVVLHREWAAKMSIPAKQDEVEELCRRALQEYRQERLRERLSEKWPYDANVNARISYDYPPTFQPGYVGPRYFASRHRVVLIAQNPGEGRDPVSVAKNVEYRAKLEAFAQGSAGFEDLNHLVAEHHLGWRIYEGKGIFREGGVGRMALLDEDVRPSIEEVGIANWFPFKTAGDQGPSKASPFRQHVWRSYLLRLVELLAPTLVVPMGAWCGAREAEELRALAGSPKVIRVQHPSARNPQDLQKSWSPLSSYLRGLA